jgi:hypothetical protein
MPIITKVVELLAKGLADTIVFLVGLLTDLVQAITPVVQAISEWLIGAIKDAIEWIGGAFSDAFNWASGAINDVGEAIGSFISWIKNAGKNILEFVVEGSKMERLARGEATDIVKQDIAARGGASDNAQQSAHEKLARRLEEISEREAQAAQTATDARTAREQADQKEKENVDRVAQLLREVTGSAPDDRDR